MSVRAIVSEYDGEVFFAVPDSKGKRVTILATIAHTREEVGLYGPVTKALYPCEGEAGRFRCWGTLPAGFARIERPEGQRATIRGALVRLVATIEQSEHDACFGFLGRPSRPEVITWGVAGQEARRA